MNLLCRIGFHCRYRDDVTIPSFRRPGKHETICATLCRRCSYVVPVMPLDGFPGELLEPAFLNRGTE